MVQYSAYSQYKPEYTGSYAVVIGIDKFRHRKIPNEKGRKDRAERFAKFLGRQGFKVKLLTDRAARYDDVWKALRSLTQTGRDDRVFIYYSGYVETYRDDPDLVSTAGAWFGCFDSIGGGKHEWVISFDEFHALKIPAKHAVYVFDNLFPPYPLHIMDSMKTAEFQSEMLTGPARIAMCAGTGEDARRREPIGDLVIEAVEQEGANNMFDVAKHVNTRLSYLTSRRQFAQFGYCCGVDHGDLVFQIREDDFDEDVGY